MNRCFPSARARSTTAVVALLATPWPWNSGSTLPLPVSDRSDRNPPRPDDDREHTAPAGVAQAVALMTFVDLPRSLWPAEVIGHSRVAHQLLEEPEVTVRP